jgi:hypothetical protein
LIDGAFVAARVCAAPLFLRPPPRALSPLRALRCAFGALGALPPFDISVNAMGALNIHFVYI